MLRLQEFQRRFLLKLKMKHLLRKFAREWRHARMWQVHNAWYPAWEAARSAAAESAAPPALETERMDEDRGTKRAAEPAELGACSVPPTRVLARVEVAQAPQPQGAGGDSPAASAPGAQPGPQRAAPPPRALSAAAAEFSPGLPMAAVEVAWSNAAGSPAAAGWRRLRFPTLRRGAGLGS